MFFSNGIPPLKDFFIKANIENVDLLSSWIEDTDIVSSFGDSNVVQTAEEIAQRFSDFSEISYIGVREGDFKGIADTQVSSAILQNILNKVYYSRQNWDELSDADKMKIQNIELQAEKLLSNNELIAVEVNPAAIISEADQRYGRLGKEMEAKGITVQDLGVSEQQVWADITTLILAETLAHEGKHGEGNMSGESVSENTGETLWNSTLITPQYAYLADFQAMQQE